MEQESWAQLPFNPGYALIGCIEDVGSSVNEFKPGDYVLSYSPHAEYVKVSVQDILVKVNSSCPTAFACGTNIIAYEVINYLKSKNISVPEDISVTGFNNFDISELSDPSITTVAVPMRKMGQIIGRKILEILKGQKETGVISLLVELIKRDSTKITEDKQSN